MHRPDPTDHEFAIVLFLLVVPFGWFAVRTMLTLIAAI